MKEMKDRHRLGLNAKHIFQFDQRSLEGNCSSTKFSRLPLRSVALISVLSLTEQLHCSYEKFCSVFLHGFTL